MADAAVTDEPQEKKGSKLPLILGLVLAILGAGGGFYATSSGLLLSSESTVSEQPEAPKPLGTKDVAFVPMDPIAISLPASSPYRQLRFRGELEVDYQYRSDVETTLPRVVDVLNTYLRAVEVEDLEAPASLTRLRSQMLRRVQVVAGPGRVNDLLIMEFVLN